MPTVSVDKQELFERLGQSYTTEEFDQLCFEFGIELDEDTTAEVEEAIKKGLPAERPQLKIEIPANRYDLLCIEGIVRALRVFLQKDTPPKYKLVPPANEDYVTISVSKDLAQVRPYFSGAVLRNVEFTQSSYDSFIDLQEKLHQNICRRRQLVSIGTHDLDTVISPFRYEARPPKDIKFKPLTKDQEYTAEELMTIYESDRHLSRYLPIIRDSPVYPIIYDKLDRVLSFPPIINSEHSKITLNTKNIFIDVTATDETKLEIVLNMVATMFSEYCGDKYSIEPIKIILPDGTTRITPDISPRHTIAHASYINACTGLSLATKDVATLLQRMTLDAQVSSTSPDEILVSIPATRPDILHECDIMEDAAIAYGFNNLVKTFPSTNTVAQPLAVSKLSDLVRRECAMAGWVEVLPLILCSHEENFEWLNKKDDGTEVVKLANPKTLEYQVVRTSLLPGLLKTVRENKSHPLPIRVFETSDIVVKDKSLERQARNIRKMAAIWCNKTAGFEVIHGLLDRLMAMLEVPRLQASDNKSEHGYYIKETDDPTFFPGRAAKIYYRPSPHAKPVADPPLNDFLLASASKQEEFVIIPKTSSSTPAQPILKTIKETISSTFGGVSSKDVTIGTLGILHPSVLEKFEIGYPCSALEFNLEPFLKEVPNVWD
jgi:phenylalanyl-tRNA synthetase beta chain